MGWFIVNEETKQFFIRYIILMIILIFILISVIVLICYEVQIGIPRVC